jgi:hypothetical protein
MKNKPTKGIRDKIRGGVENKEFENVRIEKKLKMKFQAVVLRQKLKGEKITFSEVLERLADFSREKDL